MKGNKDYWNNIYKEKSNNKIVYDLWLDKYEDIISKYKDEPVLDMGCGTGNNLLYLTERGFKDIYACDYSEEALKFDEEDIRYFFKDFNIKCCSEESMFRYGAEKRTIEFLIYTI